MTKRLYVAILASSFAPACQATANDSFESIYETFFREFAGDLNRTYRLPEGEDFSYWGADRDTYFYKTLDDEGNEKPPYWTKGDFNGDGETDRCYLLFGIQDATDVRMVVFLSTANGYDVIDVAQGSNQMAVSTLTGPSGSDDPAHAIKLSHLEGHAVVYQWTHEEGVFELR